MPTTNACDGCTVCCDLFPVSYFNKPPNTKCEHCNGGCAIHRFKPLECSSFECMWLQSRAPIEVRPDRCGIVFEMLSSRLVYGTVWKPVTDEGSTQVRSFVAQGYSVVVAKSSGGKVRVYPSEGRGEDEVLSEFHQHLEARYGNVRN